MKIAIGGSLITKEALASVSESGSKTDVINVSSRSRTIIGFFVG
jgi:hypothetical protein